MAQVSLLGTLEDVGFNIRPYVERIWAGALLVLDGLNAPACGSLLMGLVLPSSFQVIDWRTFLDASFVHSLSLQT